MKLTCLIALLAVSQANALPCRHQVVQHHAEVVVPVVNTITVAVPVYGLIPLYAQQAAYAPVPQAQATVTEQDVLKELLLEIRSMRAEMSKLSGGGVGALGKVDPPKLDAAAVVNVISRSCMKCHGQTANTDGGGFAMFQANGEFIPVRPGDARRIVQKVSAGQMPPPGSGVVSEPDRKIIVDAFQQGEKLPDPKPKEEPKPVEPKKTRLDAAPSDKILVIR